MRKPSLSAILGVATCLVLFCACRKDGNEQVFDELDRVISQKSCYAERFNRQADSLRRRLGAAPDDTSRWQMAHHLFNAYITYDIDSAARYSELMYRYAAATGDESHSLEIETALTDGSYKFLAVGLEDATTYSPIAFTASTTTLEAAEIQLADAQKAGEFFAGSTNVYTVNAETQSLGVSITLTRVVAGVLGYFKNVPYQLIAADGSMKRVTKVAVQLNQNANKTTLVAPGTELTFGDGFAYTELMSIAFDDQATKDEAKNIYTCAEVVTGSEGNPAKVENSFLVGGYSLPCAALTGKATMKVVLYAGDEALKTYPVQMENSQTDFALSRNTFYGIGHKEADNNTTGEKDPDDGDEDDPNTGEEDDPIDLSKDQIITITVNANWEAIHDLGLGDAE